MQKKNTLPAAKPKPYRFMLSVGLLSLVSVALLGLRISASDSLRYGFMFWNLFLAAVPLFLAWWLTERIKSQGWLKWPQITLSAVWLAFLPNSFYLITDLIHLRPNYEADLLFDVILLMSFIITGMILGFTGVYLVHRQLLRRTSEFKAYAAGGLLFLAVSFAICLGRYTDWNTWDIFFRPAGLLFDVSDRVVNPDDHMQTYLTTLLLFFLLFTIYAVIYEAARLMRRLPR